MASLRVLAFDHEGRPIQFDAWLDDLQLYLLSNSRDGVSLFDHTSGASLAPLETAHSGLLALYDAVVARYSSPATAALGRLPLPYIFPDLSAIATVENLVIHLRTSDARYCAALPANFLARNPPPMYITLYFIVTRLPDSRRAVTDHFLELNPTDLTVDLLEKHLLSAETSVVAVGAARGTPRTPFFEGCSPSPLAPSYTSAAAVDVLTARARETILVEVAAGVVVVEAVKAVELAEVAMGVVEGVGASLAAVVAAVGVVLLVVAAVGVVAAAVVAVGVELFRGERGAFGGSARPMTPDPGIEAASLGASESALPGTAPAEALHTFRLDSGSSRCFFRDSTTLTPLPEPVPVRLANPSRGPVLAHSSIALPCLTALSGSLSCLHLPSSSTNLVSSAALQDAMVTTTTPGGQRVSICTCTRTGRHLATVTRRTGSILYTVTTEPPQVALSSQVSASIPVAAPFLCRLLSHQTLLWHHGLGHPSLPRLCWMQSRLLVSGLPKSLPPLPPSRAPPCLPCVEGRQCAAPHSSSFPLTSAPPQTLHMDVWVPAHVSGQGRERYLLLVFYDYTRYTTVFPLCCKGGVPYVLIPWIHAIRLQLRERFREDLPVLRLHSDRGGEFSSDLLRKFCRGEGILQSFTLRASSQKNWAAKRRIGLAIEVALTSMIHAAAPHFLWLFAVWYAAHHLNL
ncbi:unnamed protein product [Closterium sp. NIES-54]